MFNRILVPLFYHKYLLFQVTLREIKARYKQSILGFAWIIFNPLIQLLVYSFVFSVIFTFPTGGVPYSIFLFIGLLPWIYLQTTLSTSATVLVENANLLKKVRFPREILPYSVILAKGVDLFFSLLLLLGFMVFYQVPFYPSIFFALLILLIQILLMTGLSLFLSVANLFYRDIQYLTTLGLFVWMYLTPVFYPLSLVPGNLVWIYKLNPMVGIIEGYRSAFLNRPFDTGAIAWSFAMSLIIFLFGYWLFKKSEDVFADIV